MVLFRTGRRRRFCVVPFTEAPSFEQDPSCWWSWCGDGRQLLLFVLTVPWPQRRRSLGMHVPTVGWCSEPSLLDLGGNFHSGSREVSAAIARCFGALCSREWEQGAPLGDGAGWRCLCWRLDVGKGMASHVGLSPSRGGFVLGSGCLIAKQNSEDPKRLSSSIQCWLVVFLGCVAVPRYLVSCRMFSLFLCCVRCDVVLFLVAVRASLI